MTVRPRVAVEGEFGEAPVAGFDESVLEHRARRSTGVATAEGVIGDATITILGDDGERIGPPQGGPPHIAASTVETRRVRVAERDRGLGARRRRRVRARRGERRGRRLRGRRQVRITGAAGARDYTLVGITEFGCGASLGGASLALFTLPEAQRLTDKQGKLDEIDIVAEDGTTPEQLARAVAAEVGGEFDVRTGSQTADEDAGDIQEGFGFLSTALLVFAGHRGLRRRLPDLQHVLDHGRPAGPRVRDAPHARGVCPAGAGGGLDRGGADRPPGFRPGDRRRVRVRRADQGAVRVVRDSACRSPISACSRRRLRSRSRVGVGATIVAALVPALRATRVAPLEALRESGGSLESEESSEPAAHDHRGRPRGARRRPDRPRAVRVGRGRGRARPARRRPGADVHRRRDARRPFRPAAGERARLADRAPARGHRQARARELRSASRAARRRRPLR